MRLEIVYEITYLSYMTIVFFSFTTKEHTTMINVTLFSARILKLAVFKEEY